MHNESPEGAYMLIAQIYLITETFVNKAQFGEYYLPFCELAGMFKLKH